MRLMTPSHLFKCLLVLVASTLLTPVFANDWILLSPALRHQGATMLPTAHPAAQTVAPTPEFDISRHIEVDFSGWRYDRRSQSFYNHIRITNVSPTALIEPVRLRIDNLSPLNAQVLNADAVDEETGLPVFNIETSDGVFAPGEEAPAIFMRVRNPANGAITFDAHVAGAALIMFTPTSQPGSIQAGDIRSLTFHAQTRASDHNVPSKVVLRRQDTGERFTLKDDGQNGDPVAGDGVFSGTLNIDATQLAADTCIPFRATGFGFGFIVNSPMMEVCVTPFEPVY